MYEYELLYILFVWFSKFILYVYLDNNVQKQKSVAVNQEQPGVCSGEFVIPGVAKLTIFIL